MKLYYCLLIAFLVALGGCSQPGGVPADHYPVYITSYPPTVRIPGNPRWFEIATNQGVDDRYQITAIVSDETVIPVSNPNSLFFMPQKAGQVTIEVVSSRVGCPDTSDTVTVDVIAPLAGETWEHFIPPNISYTISFGGPVPSLDYRFGYASGFNLGSYPNTTYYVEQTSDRVTIIYEGIYDPRETLAYKEYFGDGNMSVTDRAGNERIYTLP